MQYLTKVLISALIIVLVSEVSKRNSWLGAVIVSLPIVSILSMVWLYRDTKDVEKVVELSNGVFWLVLPSLLLFLLFPVLVKVGLGFYQALAASSISMIAGYFLMLKLLESLGVKT